MCNNITLKRKFIKDDYDNFLNENSIELDKKELLPYLYRVYKNV